MRKKGAKKRQKAQKHTGGYNLEWPVAYTDYTHTAALNTPDEWKTVTAHIRKKLLEGATIYGENSATLRADGKFYAYAKCSTRTIPGKGYACTCKSLMTAKKGEKAVSIRAML